MDHLAAQAVKHHLSESAMAATLAECDARIGAGQKVDVNFMIARNRTFDSCRHATNKAIDSLVMPYRQRLQRIASKLK
jgi:predicted dehydrogenase